MLASYKLSGKYIFISGFLFTSVLGTLSHFFYEWSGDSTFIGLVCPISESAWEHMKLLFFPALLYCFLFKLIYKNAVPNVSLPLLSGILTGTTLIPVFFYTYSGILGFTVVWIDIAIFYLCTGITFSMASKLYEQKNIARFRFLIYGLTILYSILFFIFTFIQPDIALFQIHDFSYRVRLRLLLFSICLSLHFSVCFPVHFPIHFPSSVRRSGFPSRTALFKISSIL